MFSRLGNKNYEKKDLLRCDTCQGVFNKQERSIQGNNCPECSTRSFNSMFHTLTPIETVNPSSYFKRRTPIQDAPARRIAPSTPPADQTLSTLMNTPSARAIIPQLLGSIQLPETSREETDRQIQERRLRVLEERLNNLPYARRLFESLVNERSRGVHEGPNSSDYATDLQTLLRLIQDLNDR